MVSAKNGGRDALYPESNIETGSVYWGQVNRMEEIVPPVRGSILSDKRGSNVF